MKFQIPKEEEKNGEWPIIMIVDDEPDHLKELVKLFSGEYTIITALNGNEALYKIRGLESPEKISLIILDQRMPGMQGVELLKKLAHEQIMPDTLRIMLTAYLEIDVILNAINDGHIYKFISKPYDADKLYKYVQEGVKYFFEMQYLKQCRDEVMEQNREIAELKMKIQDLTGLLRKWEGTPN